jgi:hypothetical protein
MDGDQCFGPPKSNRSTYIMLCAGRIEAHPDQVPIMRRRAGTVFFTRMAVFDLTMRSVLHSIEGVESIPDWYILPDGEATCRCRRNRVIS